MISLGQAPCDEGVVRAAGETGGCADRAKPWVLAATILGSSMAFIDSSVVTVALPAIQADLDASFAAAQWTINAYTLMLGALILVGGAAGDRFGRRRAFVSGIGVFVAASIACAAAPNTLVLIVARAFQGAGAALLVPNSLAILSAAFPTNERGKAIGTWAGFSALTAALGPILGGGMVDALSWRAIFLINVPLGIVTLGLAAWRVPESPTILGDARVDWRGSVLAVVGLGGLAYGLTAASHSSALHLPAFGPLAIGVVVLVLFVWLESRSSNPMIPLGLFRSTAFSGANAMTFLLYFALSGALFFVPYNFIQVHGYSATRAGAAFLPLTLIMGTLSRWAGGLSDRYGARMPLTLGPIIAAAGFALFAVPGVGGAYWTTFFPGMIVLGLGMAVSVAPLTTTVMESVDDKYAGAASGINNAAARVAGLLAVALLGSVAAGVFATALDARLKELHAPPEVVSALDREAPKLVEAEVPLQIPAEERSVLKRALAESFVHSFRVIMFASCGLALASAFCAWRTIGRGGLSRPSLRQQQLTPQ